jgi:hypothetical protein
MDISLHTLMIMPIWAHLGVVLVLEIMGLEQVRDWATVQEAVVGQAEAMEGVALLLMIQGDAQALLLVIVQVALLAAAPPTAQAVAVATSE